MPSSRKINMKWRWYTTWWLLPCVRSLSDHHDLSSLPFRPLSLRFSLVPLHVSRFLPLFPPGRANTAVPRVSSGTPPFGSSARRTSYLHHQIHLGLPRGARTQTAASGLAGGLRQIGHRVTRIHSGCLPGWFAGWLADWLAHRSTSTTGWIPPRGGAVRVIALCASFRRTCRRHSVYPLRTREGCNPEIRTERPSGWSEKKYANKWGREIKTTARSKRRGAFAPLLRYPSRSRLVFYLPQIAAQFCAPSRSIYRHANNADASWSGFDNAIRPRAVLFILKRKKRFPFIRHEQYLFIIRDTWRNHENSTSLNA